MTSVESLGRAYDLYRRTAATRSAIVLLVANAIPLLGVLLFGWSLSTILVLYWLENGIVGLWNVPKIVLARGSLFPGLPDLPADAALAATGSPERAAELQARWRATQAAQRAAAAAATAAAGTGAETPATGAATAAATAPPGATPAGPAATGVPPNSRAAMFLGPNAAARLGSIPRVGLALFFTFHYGVFWVVHGIFIFALPTFAGGFGASGPCLDATGFPIDCPPSAFGEVVWQNVLIAGIALFLSHGASFLLNYIGRGEYLTTSPARQMSAAYGRVIVLHVTIILGAFAVVLLGSPVGALLVLIVLKTALDLSLHLRERRGAALPPPGTVLPAPQS